jgi:hypothetical protein
VIQSVVDQSHLNHHQSSSLKSITVDFAFCYTEYFLCIFSLTQENLIGPLSYLLSKEVVHHTQILHLDFRIQGLLVSNNAF